MSEIQLEPPAPDEAHAPLPASEEGLGWRRQPMVRWFDPPQLVATGVRALLSGIFGAYADKREVQAALSRESRPVVHGYGDEPEMWIDFVADLGDGFDSTYTLAWLLAQERLPAVEPGATPEEAAGARALAATRRGRILVMGGDQVYPTASRWEYENRLSGPYSAALPWHPAEDRPRLFAIPGNHDWYDGLTAYLRQFCQERWIGGWQTRQSRSYFALELPQRWWLLGVDMQLESDIDKPQLDYFKGVAEQMQEGDHVIVCTPEPAWVHEQEQPGLYGNLAFFEKTVLCPVKAKLVLTLTGDLHHYSRYADSTGERHKITSGGGGAYLYGTHLLPDELELPKAEEGEPGAGKAPGTKTYERKAEYPAAPLSRAMRWGALRLPLRNPSFAVFMGVMYALFGWFVQVSSRSLPGGGAEGPAGVLGELGGLPLRSWGAALYAFFNALIHSPTSLLFAVLIVAALWRFCEPDPGAGRWRKWIGAAHGVAHLLLAFALTWGFARLNLGLFGLGLDSIWETVLFASLFVAEMLLVGGVLGGLLMGAALLPGVNFNEAFSSQHIENYKNFVRLHIDEAGVLRIYPVGVDRVKRWVFAKPTRRGDPYFRTRDGAPPRVRLIEDPITIPAPSSRRVLAHSIRGEGFVPEENA